MRNAILGVAVCLLSAGAVNAQTIDAESLESAGGIMTSDAGLPSLTYRAGTSTIQVRAERGVNVQELLVAAKIRPNEDPQTIIEKVNKIRQRQYPDREISIVASVPRTAGASSGVRLWTYYVYWNRSGWVRMFWNPMLAAVTFLDDVRGTWKYYECLGCSTWRYKYQILTGGSLTRVLTGYTGMGFYYVPQTYGARADIVAYFFN